MNKKETLSEGPLGWMKPEISQGEKSETRVGEKGPQPQEPQENKREEGTDIY